MIYDVLIIGSGAGGGTLARQIGSFGKEDPHSGKRRFFAARKRKLERGGGVRPKSLYFARYLV